MATKDEIFAFAAQEAERQGVPLSLVQGVVDTESGGCFLMPFGPKTKTGDRAYGPMQLMATTAKDLGVNRMEWKDNIRGGVKYLSQLSQRYDNPDLVLAAYNAGLGNVDKYGGIPPFKETQNYVQKVKNFMAKSTTDDEFVPFGQGTTTQAPTQAVGTDDLCRLVAHKDKFNNKCNKHKLHLVLLNLCRVLERKPFSLRLSFNKMLPQALTH